MIARIKSKLVGSSASDDVEERKMKATVRKMMSQQEKKVECISEIVLTFGKKETDEFAKDSLTAQNEGMPYFRRCTKEIGKHHQIVIWTRSSTAQKDFITDLKVGHALPGNLLFINGSDYGLEPILHERMKGDQRDEPTVCFWYKKEGSSSTAIDDVAISYNRRDESDLRKEKYEMLPTNLEAFGLAPAHLWLRRIERTAMPKTTDMARMKTELEDYNKMLAKDPDDPILRSMAAKMHRRIQAAKAEEDVRTKCNPTDPLMYTKEFLALNLSEINKLQNAFDRIGPDENGLISLQEFCRHIGEKDTVLPFIRHIFQLAGADIIAKDTDNTSSVLDFGTTLRCIACYCMLGGEETLQAIFSLHDPKGKGHIDNEDFLSILTMFHPRYRGRTTRALREFDLPEDGKMSFGRLKELHETFPHLLFPAFRIQETIQRHFIGCKWWQRKRRKFSLAKDSIRKQDALEGS